MRRSYTSVAVVAEACTAGAVQGFVHEKGVEHGWDGWAETAQSLADVGADAVAGTVRVVDARMAVRNVSRHFVLLVSADLRHDHKTNDTFTFPI